MSLVYKGPAFDEKMAVVRLQVLAQLAGERIHADAGKVTDGEIEIYYHDHISDYKTITYDRILVPKQKQVDPAAAEKPNPRADRERGTKIIFTSVSAAQAPRAVANRRGN